MRPRLPVPTLRRPPICQQRTANRRRRCRRRGRGPIAAELHVLRDILMHKFGREYSQAVMENRDGCVSERVR